MNELEEFVLIFLMNIDEGFVDIFFIVLVKCYDNGFSFDMFYINMSVEDVFLYIFFCVIFNFCGNLGLDCQVDVVYIFINEIEYFFNIFLSYECDFIGNLMMNVFFFGMIQFGCLFGYGMCSFCYLFGVVFDGEFLYGNNDLFYILLINFVGIGFDDLIVDFVLMVVYDELFQFVQVCNFEGFVGFIMLVFSDNGLWIQCWDFSFEQELLGIGVVECFVGDNNFKLMFDIFNFMNLFNDDWGQCVNGLRFGGEIMVCVCFVDEFGNELCGVCGEEVCGVIMICIYLYCFMEMEVDGSELFFENQVVFVYQVCVGLCYEF